MDSRLVTLGLVALLILASVVLGLTFGGGIIPQGGGGSNNAQGKQKGADQGSYPEIVVHAVRVSIPAGNVGGTAAAASSANATGQGPADQLLSSETPIPELKVTFIEQPPTSATPQDQGGGGTYVLYTNSTGVGEASLPPGNYTAAASSKYFVFNRTVEMQEKTRTFLQLRVVPGYVGVVSIGAVNPDRLLAVEPQTPVYANVVGNFSYTSNSLYVLVGSFNGSSTPRSMDVTVTGSYPAPNGAWVVLEPVAPFQFLPSAGVQIVYETVDSTVSYIAI